MEITLDQETCDRLASIPSAYCIRYESSGNGWVSMHYGFEGEQPEGGQSEHLPTLESR